MLDKDQRGMKLLFKNIKELVQVREQADTIIAGSDMKTLPSLLNAYLIVIDGRIADYGTMNDLPEGRFDSAIDASEKLILPTWCDSHTHLVYAGSRESEFVNRINGLSYEEIAAKGGGILNSAKKLNGTSEEELFAQSKARLEQLINLGTGAIEIKSGYGLNLASELKMLRVINKLKENYSLPIKSTFLGAHAIPSEYKERKSDYLSLIIDKMMPRIFEEGLADFVDVFCEKGYFSVADTQQILKAAKQYNVRSKIHVNQFNVLGGVQAAVALDALSVDHLELINEEDIQALLNSSTMATALPGCSFFLGLPYTPARELISNGLPIALASDYNPGSCPSGNMNMVVALACIKMKMTPQEAVNAATINSAYAMNVLDQVGSITRGKLANLIMTKPLKSIDMIPYKFGSNLIDTVFINGQAYN